MNPFRGIFCRSAHARTHAHARARMRESERNCKLKLGLELLQIEKESVEICFVHGSGLSGAAATHFCAPDAAGVALMCEVRTWLRHDETFWSVRSL